MNKLYINKATNQYILVPDTNTKLDKGKTATHKRKLYPDSLESEKRFKKSKPTTLAGGDDESSPPGGSVFE